MRRTVIAGCLCLPLAAVVLAMQPRTQGGLAAQLTPPVPPTYVPTPITPPPGPPTPVLPATPTATTGGQTPTPAASTTPGTSAAAFSLDAVRLSKIHNSGDLKGLVDVRPGTTVWLMIYYTLKQVVPGATQTRTYEIRYRGKTIYSVAYREHVLSGQQGRAVRYTTYTLPKELPYGSYVYRATLRVAKVSRTRSWKFSISRQERQTRG